VLLGPAFADYRQHEHQMDLLACEKSYRCGERRLEFNILILSLKQIELKLRHFWRQFEEGLKANKY